MKRLYKVEPDIFVKYIKKESPSDWKTLSTAIGFDIREYILRAEQNYQCAYTEVALQADYAYSHIDHYKKRAYFGEETFNWNNLLVSCNSEQYGAKYKDKHVRREDYYNMLNPISDNPNDFFHYSITGKIGVKSQTELNNVKAHKTIELFFLNNNSLVERRATIALQVKTYANQLSLEEIKGVIGEFHSFIESIYSTLKN